MAIRIIEGSIGSGKTYYAVSHLIKNYFKWDTQKEEWTPSPGIEILTNIDGFKFGRSLDDEIKKAGGIDAFFKVETFPARYPGKKVLIVIDEAQGPRYFHRKFYNPDVFYFFEYSRHLGVDVYLLTQNVGNLAKDVQGLAEYNIQVARRTLSFMGEFTYRFTSGGESFKRKIMKPDKRIFSLYKSMSQGEVEKLPSATRRWVAVFVALFAIAGLFFYYGFLPILMPSKKSPSSVPSVHVPKVPSPASLVASDTVKPVPVAPSIPEGEKTLPAPPVPFDGALQSVQIVALVGESGDGPGFVLYRLSGSEAYRRVSRYDFDRLCACNSFARFSAGDTVKIPL
ncbi:MAG: zonular occludens toxin domain-containing protein [Deltaproteobacteria bacterium]|nr:zonular occludens toxin domain-containing protein [Deltaproteobacteria bacterium]